MKTQIQSKVSILVIEESQSQAEQIQYILEQRDYNVSRVASGKKALAYLAKNKADLLICNNILPDMSGFDFCSDYRKLIGQPETKVMLYFAITNPEELIQIIQSGADAFIAQPFKPSTLLNKVENLFHVTIEEQSEELQKEHEFTIRVQDNLYSIKSDISRLVQLMISSYESASIKSEDLIQANLDTTSTKESFQRKIQECKRYQEKYNKVNQFVLSELYPPIQQLDLYYKLISEDCKQNSTSAERLLSESEELLKNLKGGIQKVYPEDPTLLPKQNLKLTETHVQRLLLKILSQLKPILVKKDVQLNYNLPDEDIIMNADALKVEYVINYILNHALLLSKKGSKIELNLSEKDNSVNISIVDYNSGILPNQSSEIFRPDPSQLILNNKILKQLRSDFFYCKKIVEDHQGMFDYTKTVKPTTEFAIKIPKDLSGFENSPSNQQRDMFKYPDWNSRFILIVDDVLSNYKYLKGVLGRTYAKIDWVQTGEEAIVYCKENTDVDMVLMDIHMPGLNGFETTKRIRAFNNDVKIVAQTAYDMHGENEKCLKVGCDGYLPMPIKPEELILEVKKHFES